MTKKNILHVVTVPFSIPIFFRGQFKYFCNSQNTFLASSGTHELFEKSYEYGYTPINIDINRSISPFSDLIVLIQLCKTIYINKIEVVIGHTPKAALLAMIASVIMGVRKRIYFKHGLVFETQTGILKTILIASDYLTEFLSTKIICVSKSVLNNSLKNILCKNFKYVVPNMGTCNGIDVFNKFNPDLVDLNEVRALKLQLGITPEMKVIGFVGRLAKDKGIYELLASWKYLSLNHKNLRLLLVGPIDDRDPVNYSDLENIYGLIHVNFVENTELYYSIMDIFILPSYREGFPTVNLEASSMMLPVITSKSTGCIDSIVEFETGMFTNIDGLSISNSVEDYLSKPEIMIKHGLNGRRYVLENYNQKVVWDSISAIYFN